MAKIPQASQLGDRVSLRSNRVDIPGESEAIVADSVLRAADTFSKTLEQHKEKNDRLNYTQAKSDLLAADSRIKRELEQEGDYENYSENFRTRFTESLDEVGQRITDPADRALFDAEANLIRERGVSVMTEATTLRRRDVEMGNILEMKEDLKREILEMKNNRDRIERLLSFQEYVNARVEDLGLDATWGQSQIQDFVKDVSVAQLKSLPLRTQEALLAASIDANPNPRKDDFADKQTGSLADFLQQDERVEMHRLVEKALKGEEDNEVAEAAFQQALAENPGTTRDSYAARRSLIDKSGLSADQKKIARGLLDNHESFELRQKGRRVDEGMNRAQTLIREGKPTLDESGLQVPYTHYDFQREYPEEWASFGPEQQRFIRDYSDAAQEGRHNGYFNVLVPRKGTDAEGNEIELPSYHYWKSLSDDEKLNVPLERADWRMSFKPDTWSRLVDWQDDIRTRKAGTMKFDDGLTNDQMLRSVLVTGGWTPPQDMEPEDDLRFARARIAFDKAIQDRMRKEGRNLTNTERYEELGKILGLEPGNFGYTGRRFSFGNIFAVDFGFVHTDAVPFRLMTPTQMEIMRVPIEMADDENDPNQHGITLKSGDKLTVYKMLRLMAMNDPNHPEVPGLGLQKEPNKEDMERAIAAWYAKLPAEEIERRLLGK